ncbi:hypothetical protein Bhyg_11708 [Pseudolycoriella hygida]|uniref:Uncharacterized protein n=1 Tax=Pseudolycoriella hygida TaxID=35572 RepID=A0A9Q0RYL9_9DIPT|nr:hypothetical protein Bhyg_11708 [Pseudolycoriella hygida]
MANRSQRTLAKSTCDEKKNLSKHHLILPNNKQICVETLLSQCANEEQIDRRFDAKLRIRLKKKKVALVKPKNFILKNEKLRPIVTANIKSGVFRSVELVSRKKKKSINIVPTNILYSQSSLSSRIQSIKNFCNDEWIVERTTQYMHNDWTRPVTSIDKEISISGDIDDRMKQTDISRNELKVVRSRNENENIMELVKKPTIHRLVTPDGFQLSTNAVSTLNRGFKQPLQHSDSKNYYQSDNLESLHETPISRTRFSRATRSPIKCDVDFDNFPIMHFQPNSIILENIDLMLPQKSAPSKNSFGNKNRCKTCNKVYLGRRKVMRHLKAFPEHDMQIPPKPTKLTESKSRIRTPIHSTLQTSDRLFDVLIQKIKNAPIDEKSHILFREISDFVEKLEAIRSQLLCDDNTHSSVEYLDKHCSKIFGTQEGNYHISLNILEQLASGIDPNEFASNATADPANQLDHNINVSLSSISESKIHLVEGISEESLLKTVDDLMRKEGRMGDGSFDNIEISDNAVEAVTLKNSGNTQPILNLSLDLFKFDGT